MEDSEPRRRSVRQKICLPVLLEYEGSFITAHTGVISPVGTLVLSPQDWPLETELEIENPRIPEASSAKCKVAWQGGEARPGLYKLGLEFIEPQPNFWGADYEPVPPPPPPTELPSPSA
jgi:hypothetical protein